MLIIFICRRCTKFFVSNNKFHNHIRNVECFDFNVRLKKTFSNRQFDFDNKIEIDVVDFDVVIIFTIKITKSSFESNFNYELISIVSSNVDLSKNIEIDYEYRDWNHANIDVVLFKKIESKFVCIDIESEIIIANRRFFFRQNFDFSIRIMCEMSCIDMILIHNYTRISKWKANTWKSAETYVEDLISRMRQDEIRL